MSSPNMDEIARLVRAERKSRFPEYREFTCLRCGNLLARAWHVWVRVDNVLQEVHFCVKCAADLGIDGTEPTLIS